MSTATAEPLIINVPTLDEEFRQELAAINLLLSREALWQPVDSATPFHDPRPMFYRRLEELQRKLSVTKITTLTGHGFGWHESVAEECLASSTGEAVSMEDLLPGGTSHGELYDWEITVTRRSHVAGPKSKEGE